MIFPVRFKKEGPPLSAKELTSAPWNEIDLFHSILRNRNIRSAETMRNIAANTLTNPAFNPHLNPYKTPGEMNQLIENASGNSTTKSFVTIVRAMMGK